MTRDDIRHEVTLDLVDGYEFVATFDGVAGAEPLRFDEPAPLGAGGAPNAAAVLGAAVGNCLAASLAFCLRRSRAGLGGLVAHVITRMSRNEAGRYRIAGISVELAPAIDPESSGRLARCTDLFEDFCVVTESVRAGIPVDVTVKEVVQTTGR